MYVYLYVCISLSLSLYIYIYMHIYIYIHTYTYIYICTHIHIHMGGGADRASFALHSSTNPKHLSGATVGNATPNPLTNIVDFRGFDSSIILI